MAILSTFYDTSAGVPASLVTETKWALAHPAVGSSEYGVVGPTDFKVTAHPTLPQTLNVAPGQAWGHGVFDTSDAIESLEATPPPATGSRWDMVCLRRDWGPAAGGPSYLAIIPGGTVAALPAARADTPGTLDDQPLFLAEWVAGQTKPRTLLDVRVWAGNGGAFAYSSIVRSYLTRIGSRVQFGSTQEWTLEIGDNDLPQWTNRDDTLISQNITTLGPGWKNNLGNGYQPRIRRQGNFVQMMGGLQQQTGELSNLLTIPVGYRPEDSRVTFVGSGVTSGGMAYQLVLSNNTLWIPLNYMTGPYNGEPLQAYSIHASWTIT